MHRRSPATHRTPAHGRPAPRSGFTLIELLIVIVIIGILAAFILPALSGVQKNARIAECVTDIKNLEEAIGRFEQEYGVQPPSFVAIAEGGSSSTAGSAAARWPVGGAAGTNARTSRARLREIWPQLAFEDYGEPTDYNNNGTADPYDTDLAVDLNSDGDIDDVHLLNGAECLVFFLGGVCTREDLDADGDLDFVPQGFSTNPNNPFIIPSTALAIPPGSRKGPFFQFDPNRLVDVDGDGFPEYLDTLPDQTVPYQYFSSYGGTGYLPRGLDGEFGPPLSAAGEETDNETLANGLVSHYILSDTNTGAGYPTPATDNSVHKPQGFQIISPGFDATFGVGGAYTDNQPIQTTPDPTGQRALNAPFERDNITNFANGTLN